MTFLKQPHSQVEIEQQRHVFTLQYTPTVVASARRLKGRTPLTPSQGYFSYGGSRSPSSRSRKPGMNSSLVSVYSLTRPAWP